MNRLGFLIARIAATRRRWRASQVPQSAILDDLAGKHIALIGNARALTNPNMCVLVWTAPTWSSASIARQCPPRPATAPALAGAGQKRAEDRA